MADSVRSSTSSSEPETVRGFPFDFGIALLVVLAVEGVVRLLESSGRLGPDKEWETLGRVRSVVREGLSRPADFLLIGDSTMARVAPSRVREGFPERKDLLVAEATLPGASTMVLAALCERALIKPKHLVVGVNTQATNTNGSRHRDHGILLESLESHVNSRFSWKLRWALHDHVALYRKQFWLRDVLIHPWRFRLSGTKEQGKPPPEDRPFTSLTPHVFAAEARHEFGGSALSDLKRIVALARKNRIHLAFVNMPIPKEYAEFWDDGQATYTRYLARLTAFCEENTVPLIDLNDGSWVRSHFSDTHHLGTEGAAMAASRLAAALRDLGWPKPASK